MAASGSTFTYMGNKKSNVKSQWPNWDHKSYTVEDLAVGQIRFDNGATGVIMGNRASGGRIFRSELHGVGFGCYMDMPGSIEIHEDDQKTVMGGWEVDGVAEEDVYKYEGVYTMHQHFIECIHSGTVPLTDIRDVIHTIKLVDMIEGNL